MKLKLPLRWNLSENTVLSVVFAAIFLTGLGVFSLSASIIVSAAFLAVSALAAYIFAKQRHQTTTTDVASVPENKEVLAHRIAAVETALKSIDGRFAMMEAAVEAQVARQMDPLVASVQIMATILEQQSRSTDPSVPLPREQHQPVHQPLAPVAERPATTPPQETLNPLQKRRFEALVRESLQSGKLKTSTQEIIALPTARPVYRLMQAQLEGIGETPFGEAELRASSVPANLIRLFDRVRFAHAFELATKLALSADGPSVVCPLTFETLEDPIAGAEIAELFRQKPGLAQKFCFLVREDTLFFDFGLVGQHIRHLINAGCRFALELARDIRVDPFVLQNHGVSLLFAPASLVLAARDGKVHTDIDPVDLVHLLDRRDIDLAISAIKSDMELRAIRALGMNLILRASGMPTTEPAIRLKPESPRAMPHMPRIAEERDVREQPISVEPEPLRARLRRLSA
jgi:hypothetical protein